MPIPKSSGPCMAAFGAKSEKPQWKWLLAGVICTIAAASAEGFTITLVKQVIDQAFIEKSMSSLYLFALQIVAAFGAKGAFSYSKDLIMTKAGLLTSARLQNRIYSHMMKMDVGKFYGGGIGKHLNYFGVQGNAVQRLVTGTIIQVVQNIATLTITIGIMVYYAPQMCATLLFLVPAIVIPITFITRKKRRLSVNRSVLQTMYRSI